MADQSGGRSVSCVVATFNSGRWVGEAIDSVLGQSERPGEVIVVDGGSSDDTTERARAFGERVRVIEIPDQGPAATRNRGIAEAAGDLVAFLDGDDLWHVEKLERQLARFEERPELQCSVTHAQNFWEASAADEADAMRGHPRAAPVPGYATTSLLARREVFSLVGPLDDSLWYSDSTDWFLRARTAGVVIELMPDVLVRRRLHDRNLTRRGTAAGRAEYLALLRRSLAQRRSPGS